MSKKYFARLSKSTSVKRKTFWNKLGSYPFTKDEYDRAKEVPGDSMETKPSKYNKKYKMMFGEEKKRSVTALQKKTKASGVPYSILKQVYNRGMAAWVTGHKPGASQSAWAFARVNSFLTKGKTWYGPDADLAKKARKYLKEEHIFQYNDWGWIAPDGKSFRPNETDKTHTSILLRLAENPKLSRYGLDQKETEYSATNKGWIRWLLDKGELRFNTSKWNGSIPVQKAMLDIINKFFSAKEFSFEWADKDRVGNNLYRRIEVQNSGDFILKLSGERRKRLMGEDQDYETEMISGQLKKIIDLSTETLNVIQNQTEIPAWIQDKISVSTHNAEAIFDYYNYSEEKIQEETQMKKVVIFPGGFHPFHKGHFSVYTAIKKKFPDADVYVASTNTQTERPFSFEDKEYLASQLGVPKESFVQVKIPYVAKEITQKYDPKNTSVIFALSEKDANRISYTKKDGTPGYFAKWTGENVEPLESKGYIYITPKIDFKIAGKQVDSASMIRKMYKEADDSEKTQIIKDMYPGGDVNAIRRILDNNLTDSVQESVEIISEIIRCSKKTGKNICFVFSKKGKNMGGPYSEPQAKKRLRQIEFFKHLNK